MTIIDLSKIESYVFQNLSKSETLLKESYNLSLNLKTTLSSKYDINEISKNINEMCTSIKSTKVKLENKIEEINKIENKSNKINYNIKSKINLMSENLKIITKENLNKLKNTGCKIVKNSKVLNIISKFFSSIEQKYLNTNAKFKGQINSTYKFENEKTPSKELTKSKLDEISSLAKLDTQINTNGKFSDFTDFQNVMISDLCLMEILWDGEEYDLEGKTISELYLESLSSYYPEDIEYDKLVFDEYTMMEMTKKENKDKYKTLVLGKLVRYGFSDLKINKKISGEDGFDAFILEDVSGNTMVYFPCTNLVETEDFLYDSYPLMDTVFNNSENIKKIAGIENVFNSQQNQAKKILEDTINGLPKDKKIIVGGFSLGGSLAECSYIDSYKKYPDKLGNIILYNPYHNRLSVEESKILKKDNNLKLYVCEGDSVSTVFNYNEFSDVAKPIYIDYKNNINATANNVNNENSLLNLVVNEIKGTACDNLITSIEQVKDNLWYNLPAQTILFAATKSLKHIKNSDLDAVNSIKNFNQVIKKISPIFKLSGNDIYENYNLEFLNNLQYLETIFTSIHLTYSVDTNKTISFDENGKIKSEININNNNHKVEYPSFANVSNDIFGSNIYDEVIKMSSDLNL